MAGISLLACGTALRAQTANAPSATAQPAATVNVSVPAGSLEAALLSLGRQTNLRMLYPSNLTAGKRTAGVSGRLTPRQAVTALLAGTGLQASFTGANTVRISGPSAPATGPVPSGAALLDTIDVQAVGNPNAVIGNLPPPYAGGQVATGGQLGLLGNRSVMNTPFSQSSYTAKLAQDQNARTVDDVLQNDPSVRKGSSPGNGVEDFMIRGFEVAGRDLLFNGLAAVAPSNGTAIMAESLERIEVLKGPNATLNGVALQSAVGGAINVIPKRAPDYAIAQVTPDYGSESQLGGHVDVGRRFGANNEFGIRFNGVYRDGDTAIDHQSRQQHLAALALDHRGERFRFAIDLGYQYDDLQGVRRGLRLGAGLPIPQAPDNRTNYNNPFEYQTTGVYYGTVQSELDITPNITAFTTFGGNQLYQDFTTANLAINGANGSIAATTVRNSAYIFYGQSGNAGLRSTFHTGPVQHQAVVAYAHTGRAWRIAQGPLVNLQASNLYNLTYTATPPAFADYDQARPSNEIAFSGYMFGDTLSMLDERLQVTLGVREQKATVTRLNLVSGAATSRYDQSALTPMVGVLVKPFENLSLYANYIEGLQEGGVAPVTAANAGEALAPFVAEQHEVGAKWDLGRFTTTLAVFQITQPSAAADPVTNVFEVNGEQRNRGVELNLFGEVADGVRFLGGALYLDSELTRTNDGLNIGNRPQGVSPFHFVAGGEWDTPFVRGLTLTGRVVHTSANYLDIANRQEVPGWTRLDLGARYRFERDNGKPVVIRAFVTNVLDADYWVNSSSQLGLSEPLTFRLSTSFDF